MITLKEAFEDLHDRMQKQIAEKIWEIERVKELEGKALRRFTGLETPKKELVKQLKNELEERKCNLETLKRVIKNHANGREPK